GSEAGLSIGLANLAAANGNVSSANATVMRSAGTPGEASARENAAVQAAKAQTALDEFADSAYGISKQSFNNPGMAALDLQNELAEEKFDAMRYSFEVSSPTPLNRPYLVFILRYHEKDAKPGTKEGTVIYAKSIAPIGDKPSKINILQSGMPIGFVVDECQVRLYNGGQEVATNVAPRRVVCPATKPSSISRSTASAARKAPRCRRRPRSAGSTRRPGRASPSTSSSKSIM
ncbi:MAG: hypothetical protein ABUL61_01215, partial [Oleiharenicola lentus]